MFQKEDAYATLSILLPRRQRKNKIIWHYDRKGKYSVKSGYQMALNMKSLDSTKCSNNKNTQLEYNLDPYPL